MPAHRLRAWFLATLSLALAFVIALPVCFVGVLLTVGYALGDLPTDRPRLLLAVVPLLIARLIGVGVLVLVSVALVAGERFVLLPKGGRSFRLRLRIRTLVASIAALALCCGLLVFADRTLRTFRKVCSAARAHEAQAASYRWLQGLDSDAGGIFHPRPPDPKIWSRRQLEYFRAMDRYHDGLRRKYDAAARHPWLSVPPDPPKPREPDWRLDFLDDLWKIIRASLQTN
jgi:hypothetical protein